MSLIGLRRTLQAILSSQQAKGGDMAGKIARPIPGPSGGLQSVIYSGTNVLKTPPNKTPAAKAAAQLTSQKFPTLAGSSGGGVTQWHEVVLWFLGAIALL